VIFLLASYILIPIILTLLCTVLTGPPDYRLAPDEAPGSMGDGDLSPFLLLLWPLGLLMLPYTWPPVPRRSGFELEVVKVLQAMSLAKPATDPDSGIFTASMA
jgi:hypothetical protein